MQQAHDIAIVHLTDLHFPVNPSQPFWTEPMARALRQIGSDRNLQILGLAVTGDIVDGPSVMALHRVKLFLEESAKALGIERGGTVDWERVWLVDGNHDYRKRGLFRTKGCAGIEEGGIFSRLTEYADPQNRFLVVGLNSSKQGPAARGRVDLADLRTFQKAIEAKDAAAFRYRIALVHHHFLPMPDRPQEFDNNIESIKRIIFDEAFKLLDNAGLTTNILLKGSVNLVLHGHEHKEFAANVNYHGPSGERHVMAVVGGNAARTGFQVVYFRRSGDVDLVRYALRDADYEQQGEIVLWSYSDWKRLEWERQARQVGHYEHAEQLFELSEIGDARQTADVTNIFGGERTTISQIPFTASAGDEKFGRVALEHVHDKEAQADVPSSCLPASGPKFSFSFKVNPEATRRKPHRGFKAARISSNNFALTQEEKRLRTKEGEPTRTEHVGMWYRYPVRRMILTQRFPRSYLPKNVDVRALHRSATDRDEDTVETLRAKRKLINCRKDGMVLLDLDWVTPDHEYQFVWELPSQEHVFDKYDDAVLARSYITELTTLQSADKRMFEQALTEIRDNSLELIAEKAGKATVAKYFRPELETLSLWGYDRERREIRVVAATFEPGNPFWSASLQYGAGVRGKAMRRGLPEFWRLPSQTNIDYYHRFEACPHETFLLAVPISLLPSARGDASRDQAVYDSSKSKSAEAAANMGLCWLVACLGSTQQESLLSHLLDPEIHREVAVFLHFSMVNAMKGFVT